ncbi:MAG: 3-deoxy-D-manno-octulosonic acid transferase [Acidobacteriota bacterium]
MQTLSGRLGGYKGKVPKNPLWIHAVSVGEVAVAATLVRSLPSDLPLLVTTITPTGQQRALEALGRRAAVTYLPFDLGFAIGRFLRRFQPRSVILVEGDLWPLLLKRLGDRKLPVVVVNGRIGDRSFRRMRRLQPVLGPLFGPVTRFGMQTKQDCSRLEALRVSPAKIDLLGNIKFDSPTPSPIPELESQLRRLAGTRQILIAGSTMPGEEGAVLDAFRQIGGGRQALLVLAPRHPERCSQVESLVAKHELLCLRRSAIGQSTSAPDVILLDTLGELAPLYAVGLGSFIGGTLVPTGGHNPIEAAQLGSAIAVGPSMENFREISRIFDEAGAWQRIDNSVQLADVWRLWLADPASARSLGSRAKQVADENRGALERTLAFLQPVLQGANGSGVRHGVEA